MRTSQLRKNQTVTAGEAVNRSQGRRVIVRRLNATLATYISPIERWADNNYKPYELDYLLTQKTDSTEIVAPLHGYQPQDVHIDIAHGHVIILLADDEDIALGARQEYYGEVPLPPEANVNDVNFKISPGFLTVYIGQKQPLLKRVVAFACRFKLTG